MNRVIIIGYIYGIEVCVFFVFFKEEISSVLKEKRDWQQVGTSHFNTNDDKSWKN